MEAQIDISSRAMRMQRPPKGLRQRLERLLAGVSLELPESISIPTPDGPLSRDEVIARLAAGVARFEAIDKQLVALRQTRQLLLQDAVALQRMCSSLNDAIAAIVGRESPRIEHFGIKQRKPRQPLTSEQQLSRAMKARETRRMRHTKGRRQKAAIRYQGVVGVRMEISPTPSLETPAVPIDTPAHGTG